MSIGTTDERLSVALLNPCFWPEIWRGAERIARSLADELLLRGHCPRLITSHPGRPMRELQDGMEVVRNWRPPPEQWLRRRGFLEYLTQVPFSYASLLRGDDDLVQALYVSDGLAAARWSRRTGRPSILSYMGITTRPALTDRRLRLEITSAAARGCTAVTALSRAASDELWRWLRVEARVIYPPVDIGHFSPGGERASCPTIICPAAVEEPRKRVEDLLAVFGRLRRRLPDARLLLARPRANELARRIEAGHAGVEWIDPEHPQALIDAYRRAWVCALPSIGEAFGLVLAEALACGTPVVGTRSGAIPEIIDRAEIGRLFPAGDQQAIERALLESFELARDPSTISNCRDRALDFSAARCGDAYEQLYGELLA